MTISGIKCDELLSIVIKIKEMRHLKYDRKALNDKIKGVIFFMERKIFIIKIFPRHCHMLNYQVIRKQHFFRKLLKSKNESLTSKAAYRFLEDH